MATNNSTSVNGSTSASATSIPRGTAAKSESHLLEALKAVNARNFDTLADVALTGINGEPIDDKTYLMERIIQLTADLPLHDRMSDTLTNNFLNQLWNDLSHPPNSYLGYDYVFRKADGSNNNIQWPHIGQAYQPYARSVRPRKMQPPRPDPEVIFDSVLKRKEFVPHPNKISSVLFYVASIIIHDCFHTSHNDYAISETSSYLDLAPLYGSTEKQQMAMRTGKDGKIKPDCFSDNRILGFPPGVGVLLIMFNRFHNHVVENLANIDEGGRFSALRKGSRGLTGLTAKTSDGQEKQDPEKVYDEALFQTGRLITTGLYVNIILQDYVRTILGLNRVDSLWTLDPRADAGKAMFGKKIPEATGNQVSAEFSLVYRWHSCVSQRDEAWTDRLLKKIMEDSTKSHIHDKKSSPSFMQAAAEWADNLIKTDPHQRSFEGLKRQPDGRFADDDLCNIWCDSVDDVAGAYGASHVPTNLKFVEVLSMLQARSWNLASLNEFREYFKLQPHKTFEDINPDPHVAKQLERLYGHPDNVEIYPGIVVESAKKSMSPGSGLCASWTTSRAILADAVALVRGDRFYTVDYTPSNLTNWGFQQASYDLDINWGSVFYKLVLNAFPNNLSKNSIYAHFPLVNKGENKTLLQDMKRAELYNFDRPGASLPPIKTGVGTGLGAKALTDSSDFASPWITRSAVYGASQTVQANIDSKMSFAEAVLSNTKWEAITTKFYATTLEKLWQEKQYELGGYQQIDILADVLNAAHVSYITSVLGIPIKDKEPQGLLSTFGHLFEHAHGVNPEPKGLSQSIRDFTHWLADAVESAFQGSHEGELGAAAFAKLKEANGANAKEMAWQDILPTSALILTTLSRSSASAVEKAVREESSSSTQNGPPSSDVAIAVRATCTVGEAEKGQLVVVHLSDTHNHDAKTSGAEIELAQKAAAICNKAITDLLAKVKQVKRVPGPQGIVKKIVGDGGDVKYLNEIESDYVAYPVSLKLRWTK